MEDYSPYMADMTNVRNFNISPYGRCFGDFKKGRSLWMEHLYTFQRTTTPYEMYCTPGTSLTYSNAKNA